MKTCSTCKHWKPDALGFWEMDYGYGRCKGIPDGSSYFDKDRLAYTEDSDMYGSHINTRKDFGCVLHEEKT